MYLDAEERKKELMAQNRVSDGMMFKMDFDPRIIGKARTPEHHMQSYASAYRSEVSHIKKMNENLFKSVQEI